MTESREWKKKCWGLFICGCW